MQAALRSLRVLWSAALVVSLAGCGPAPAPGGPSPSAPGSVPDESAGAEVAPDAVAPGDDDDAGEQEAPVEARAFLWRVRRGDATVYLLGSIHVGGPDFYPLPDAVEAAFSAADALAFEVDLTPQAQQASALQLAQAGMFPAGETLWDGLEEETAALLRAHLEAGGQSPETVQQMRPWLLAVTLTMAAYMQAGLRPELGIDMHLHGRATAAGKRVLAIEQPADQIRALSEHPPKVQDLMLREALQSLDDIAEGLDGLVELWRTGDAEAMAAEIHESLAKPEFSQLYEALFLARNRRMAEAARGYLDAGGTTLVVVGTGHLVGAGSVVELLAKDLEVTQL